MQVDAYLLVPISYWVILAGVGIVRVVGSCGAF